MKTPLLTVTRLQHVAGFAWGFSCPVLRLDATVAGDEARSLTQLTSFSTEMAQAIQRANLDSTEFRQASNKEVLPPAAPGTAYPLHLALHWIHGSLLLAQVPVFEDPQVLSTRGNCHSVAIPVFFMPFATLQIIVDRVVRLINLAALALPTGPELQSFIHFVRQLKESTQTSSNVPRFLRTAFDLGIQTTYVAGNVIQYGQGANARWLDSSFTDATPFIGSMLARNKLLTNNTLRQAGIPMAPQIIAPSADHAVAAARELGFPVVVKAADKDGGVAVYAGLTSEREVRIAHREARQQTANVIVEKHIEGRDYRLNIYHGKVLWAIERVPAGLVGDGESTLRQLLEEENRNPLRNAGANSPLKPLAFDAEARQVLKGMGLSPESIPGKGRFVPLRRRANIAMGGTPVSVMDRLHPDNVRLAVRAATLLSLDVAGVDLILPDIERSWLETGGVVCEVNAQPQLGAVTSMHTYGELLRQLVPARGRIPIALLIGGPGLHGVIAAAAEQMDAAGVRAGWSNSDGVFIGADRIHCAGVSTHDAGRMLLLSREVEAALLAVDASTLPASGLPCHRYHLLVIDASCVQEGENAPLDELLAMVLPACIGKILVVGKGQVGIEALPSLEAASCAIAAVEPDRLAEEMRRELLAARSKTETPGTDSSERLSSACPSANLCR